MKYILVSAVCLMAVGVGLFAQEGSELETWMKTINGANGSLRTNLKAQSGEAASADAKKVADALEHVHGYFAAKHVDDAAKFAADARDGYKMVADQAAAGKFEEATASLRAAGANCGGCHSAHREKGADGSYKVK